VIFNRKRNLDIPAVGHVSFMVVQPSRKEIKRKYKKFLSGLDEENRLRLSIALSEQEEHYGANMLDIMKDDDLPEIKAVMKKKNCDFGIAMSKVFNIQHKRRASASRSPSPSSSTTVSRRSSFSFFRPSRSRSASPARSVDSAAAATVAAPVAEGIAAMEPVSSLVESGLLHHTHTVSGSGIAFQEEETIIEGSAASEAGEEKEGEVVRERPVSVSVNDASFYEIPQETVQAPTVTATPVHDSYLPRRRPSFTDAPLPPQQHHYQSMYYALPPPAPQQQPHVMQRVQSDVNGAMYVPCDDYAATAPPARPMSMPRQASPYQQQLQAQPQMMMVYPDGTMAYPNYPRPQPFPPQQQFVPQQCQQPQFQQPGQYPGQYQQQQMPMFPPQYQHPSQYQQANASFYGGAQIPQQQQQYHQALPHNRSLPDMMPPSRPYYY